jgi:hypothetical protein
VQQGWKLGRPFHGRARVSDAPAAEAKAAAAEAKAAVSAAARGAASDGASAGGPGASAAAVATAGEDTPEGRVLAKELGGKVAAIPDDFFLYQFVFRSHIRQFHEEGGRVTEDWSLGRWAAAGGLGVVSCCVVLGMCGAGVLGLCGAGAQAVAAVELGRMLGCCSYPAPTPCSLPASADASPEPLLPPPAPAAAGTAARWRGQWTAPAASRCFWRSWTCCPRRAWRWASGRT